MRPHDAHGCEIPGDEVRSVRDHWAMSREEFAQQFGVGRGTVYDWERYGISCRTNKFDFGIFEVLRLSRDVLGNDNNEKKID